MPHGSLFTVISALWFLVEMSGDYVNSHYVHTDRLILDKILTVSGERFSVQLIHFTFVFQVFQLKINSQDSALVSYVNAECF